MRAKDVEDPYDFLIYGFEIVNPLGYVMIAFDDDPDLVEKAEHALILGGSVATAFHLVTAMGTGGYWANLPPGAKARFFAQKKFLGDLTVAAARTAGKAAHRGVGVVRRHPGVIAASVLFGAGMFLQDLYHDLSGMHIGDMRFVR